MGIQDDLVDMRYYVVYIITDAPMYILYILNFNCSIHVNHTYRTVFNQFFKS